MSHGESDASRDGGGDPAGAPGPAERQLGQSVLPRLEEKAHASIRIDLASSDGTGAGGARTGRYVLRGELGRGGVGVVLQGSDADLGREVAIKVLREEFENQPDVVKRFVEEAQIGGQLQHPGVVPVYDLGLSDGRPFFAMRLIRGKALDVLLAQREQPSAERRRFLDIFEKVCQTVAYAHARGVIHRDLKPSNVMVGAFGEVQVVDWGMGKVLGTGPRPAAASTSEAARAPVSDEPRVETVRSESNDTQSVLGSMMGTPGYMPPEQAKGELDQIDERSDVFALGAMLFEILVGEPPQVGAPMERLMAAYRWEADAATERLAASQPDPELEALVLACLAREPKNRPASAQVVAEAVAAHLTAVEERAHRAQVEAAEAKAREAEASARAAREEARAEQERAEAEQARMRAEAERKRRRAAVVLTLALAVGAAGTTVGMLLANEQRATAERAQQAEQERAQGEREAKEEATKRLAQVQKGNEILGAVFGNLDPSEVAESGLPLQSLLAEQLDRAADELQGDSTGDPRDVFRLQMTLASSLQGLGEFARALTLLQRAEELATSRLSDQPLLRLEVLQGLAVVLVSLERGDEALEVLADAEQLARGELGPDDARTWRLIANRGGTLRELHRPDEAREVLEQALAELRRLDGPSAKTTLLCQNNLAAAYVDRGDHATAYELYADALPKCRSRVGASHPTTLLLRCNVTNALESLGRFEEAVREGEAALLEGREAWGPESHYTVMIEESLVRACRSAGLEDRAQVLLTHVLSWAERRLGEDHWRTLRALDQLGHCEYKLGHHDAAASHYKELAARNERLHGSDNEATLMALAQYAENLHQGGHTREGMQVLEQLRPHTETHPRLLVHMASLAALLAQSGDRPGALRVLEQSLGLAREKLGTTNDTTLELMDALGLRYYNAGRFSKSVPLFEAALAARRSWPGGPHPKLLHTLLNMGVNYTAAGRVQAGKKAFAEAVGLCEVDPSFWEQAESGMLRMVATAYGALDRRDDELEVLRRLVARLQKESGGREGDTAVNQARSYLGAWLFQRRRFEEAIPIFEAVLGELERTLGRESLETIRTMGNLGMCHLQAGHFEAAVPLLEVVVSQRAKDPQGLAVTGSLAMALHETGQPAKAAAVLRETLEEVRAVLPPGHPALGDHLSQLGFALLALEDFAGADAALTECLAIREKLDPEAWSLFNARSLLGEARLGLGETEEAEPLLREGYEGVVAHRDQIPPGFTKRVDEARARLVKLLRTTDRDAEADALEAEAAK